MKQARIVCFLSALFALIFVVNIDKGLAQCSTLPGLSDWYSPPGGAGVFVCAQSLDNGCGCEEAQNCQYIHIQNLALNGTPGVPCGTGCIMDWIEVRFTPETNSTKFNICNPHKQWGQDCWSALYSPKNLATNTYTGTNMCHDWSTQTLSSDGKMHIRFDDPGMPLHPGAPSGCSDGCSDWDIQDGQHFSFTVCGGMNFVIVIHWAGGGTSSYTPVTCVGNMDGAKLGQ